MPFSKEYHEKVFSEEDPYGLDLSLLESFRFQRLLDVIDAFRPEPDSVFEIGCGGGRFTGMLAERYPGAEVLTIDLSRSALRRAATVCEDYDNVSFIEGDIQELLLTGALGAEGFDVVVQCDSMYHLFFNLVRDRQLFGYYREIADLLETGGLFIEVESVSASSRAPLAFCHSVARRFFPELQRARYREWCELKGRRISYEMRAYQACG